MLYGTITLKYHSWSVSHHIIITSSHAAHGMNHILQVRLPLLEPMTTYYWRVETHSGKLTSSLSLILTFGKTCMYSYYNSLHSKLKEVVNPPQYQDEVWPYIFIHIIYPHHRHKAFNWFRSWATFQRKRMELHNYFDEIRETSKKITWN